MRAMLDRDLVALCERNPLAVHGHFFSRDRDEVQSYVEGFFCRHNFQLVNRNHALDTELDHLRIGSVAMSIMRYGADVLVEPGPLENFYLVQIPYAGLARISFGKGELVTRPGVASVQHPVSPLHMHWNADCRKIVLRFDRARFERFVESCIGRPQRDALFLKPDIDLNGLTGQMLVDQVKSALRCVEQLGYSALPPLLATHLETSLMGTLLFLQPHDRSEEFADSLSGSEPRVVRRVREYLEAHADEPIDMPLLARVAGVPVRTLYHQFQRTLGIAPMQLLRDLRMDRVHRELVEANANANVTRIALNWGFEHLGRFAAVYRQRYGESPRETLRRSRSGSRPH